MLWTIIGFCSAYIWRVQLPFLWLSSHSYFHACQTTPTARARGLHCVYVSLVIMFVPCTTIGILVATRLVVLFSSSDMWDFLEYISTLMHGMNQVLRTVSTSDTKLLREGLSPRARSASMSFHGKDKKKSPRTQSKAVPHVTGEDGGLLPGREFPCRSVCTVGDLITGMIG